MRRIPMTKKTDLLITALATPTIHQDAFVAKGAVVIGTVTLKKNASVWYNAVLRGDINKITVGENSNIQDGTVIHVENDRECYIGNNVTIGHGAILHGCTIEDGCLIGMGAIILNGAVIKKGSVIGAGALIKENTIVDQALYVGVPAKMIKSCDPSVYDTNVEWAMKYVELSKIHKNSQQ